MPLTSSSAFRAYNVRHTAGEHGALAYHSPGTVDGLDLLVMTDIVLAAA